MYFQLNESDVRGDENQQNIAVHEGSKDGLDQNYPFWKIDKLRIKIFHSCVSCGLGDRRSGVVVRWIKKVDGVEGYDAADDVSHELASNVEEPLQNGKLLLSFEHVNNHDCWVENSPTESPTPHEAKK